MASMPRLVALAVGATTHRGSDVRLDVGRLMKRVVWPRLPWKHEFAWDFKHPSHITDLECRALATAVAWRLRRLGNFPCRFLHLGDNQAVLALQVTPCKLSAVLLLTMSVAHFGYVETDKNPADLASRRHAAGTVRLTVTY
eukprot:1766939-Amphidinium_carterae.1